MKLLEIKNNLAKIAYDETDKLALAEFVTLVDNNNSYVGQIVNLKADVTSNYAIAKLIFIFNQDGIVDNYDGSIPSIKAELSKLSSQQILSLLPVERPVAIGHLAQQNAVLKVDETLFEKNLTICAEKFENIATIINNFTLQLINYGEKTVIIDTDHTFGEVQPVRFRRDFKLPLNAEMIDFIYENDLEGVEAASKAVIQDIFYEVQQYTKTIPDKFIPFTSFLNVVSEQYKQTGIPELALLKSKLLKYGEENIFAETKEDIDGLKNAIESKQLTYIDIAEVSDAMQKELIGYIHKVTDAAPSYTYVFVKLTNNNADKKLLRQLIDNEHVFTVIICSHGYKYLPELKQRAENLIFFAPQTLQHDFASYNTLLNKLNPNEFIVYGALTQNVPFVVELSEISQDGTFEEKEDEAAEIPAPVLPAEPEEEPVEENTEDMVQKPEELLDDVFDGISEDIPVDVQTDEQDEIPEIPADESGQFDFDVIETAAAEEEEETPADEIPEIQENPSTHDELVEQVAKDVDEVFYTKQEELPTIEDITEPDKLTEDDLDFIDDLAVEQPAEEQEQFEISENNENSFDEQPELITEEEIITEEPVQEDFPSDYEVENNADDDLNLDEPQPPVVPVYPSDEPVLSDDAPQFEQGDMVSHPKYGKGVIEKLIKYGNKTLCSISFENIGRRLLDPAISEIEKI